MRNGIGILPMNECGQVHQEDMKMYENDLTYEGNRAQ